VTVRPDQPRCVAVVGAFSFFGRRLVRALDQDPAYRTIVALDVRSPQVDSSKMLYRRLDLTEPAVDGRMAEIFEHEAVDTVAHLAYLSLPVHQQTWAHELETIGTMYVLNACAEARVRHVVTQSTTMCYGAHPKNPNLLTESHPLRGAPTSRWVSDKVDAEQQLATFAETNHETTTTVLRLAPTLGPTVDNYWTRHFRRPVVHTLLGFDPLMQFLHEDDAAEAIKRAVDLVPGGAINIVPPGVLPVSQVTRSAGRRNLPLPLPAARALFRALWTAQVVGTPPGFLDYLRYLFVAGGDLAQEALGFTARYTTRQTVDAFCRAAPATESRPVVTEAVAP